MKLLTEIDRRTISFVDPDHEPGAVEREAKARASAAGLHFNATEALKKELAQHFNATVRTWKSTTSVDKEEYAALQFPNITTKSGLVLDVRIDWNSSNRYYVLSVAPKGKRKEVSFVPSRDKAKELQTLIRNDWEKATDKKLVGVQVPTDSGSTDTYHSAIHVMIGGPSAELPTEKYIKGVEEILNTLQRKL